MSETSSLLANVLAVFGTVAFYYTTKVLYFKFRRPHEGVVPAAEPAPVVTSPRVDPAHASRRKGNRTKSGRHTATA